MAWAAFLVWRPTAPRATARALIGAGADMTITNNEGSSPLHIAAFFCRTEIVRALLDKGADKEAKNMSGSTPLDTVAGPFDEVRGIYDEIRKGLEPLGLELDYEKIKATRPQIAEMLRGPALDTNLMDKVKYSLRADRARIYST